MTDESKDRRSTDLRIGHIETSIRYLSEAENRNSQAINSLSEKMDLGFKEISRSFSDYKATVNKPNYIMVLASLTLLGSFAVTWANYMITPLKDEVAKIYTQIQPISSIATDVNSLYAAIGSVRSNMNAHLDGGHPHSVLSEVRSLEKAMQANFSAQRDYMDVRFGSANEKIDTINYEGSALWRMKNGIPAKPVNTE